LDRSCRCAACGLDESLRQAEGTVSLLPLSTSAPCRSSERRGDKGLTRRRSGTTQRPSCRRTWTRRSWRCCLTRRGNRTMRK
jgi:hypothetical protein